MSSSDQDILAKQQGQLSGLGPPTRLQQFEKIRQEKRDNKGNQLLIC
jgi:hypothetical protein